jgi:hypothetical protein
METLFTSWIPVVQDLFDHGDVPVPHTGNAVYSIDREGHRWIRKRECNIGVEELLAEMLGWLVARKLDVPVPDGAVFLMGHDRSWLSAQVPNVVHWAPERAPFVINVDGLAAMMTLDALIMNTDRHAGNILLQPSPNELHLRLWAIDHGQALVGWPLDFAKHCKEITSPRYLARGLPLDLLLDHALEVAELATKLSMSEIQPMVIEACTIAEEKDAQIIIESLAARCANAPTLVEGYLKKVGSR